LVLLVVLVLLWAYTPVPITVWLWVAIGLIAVVKLGPPVLRALRGGRKPQAPSPATVGELHARALSGGGGAYLATGERGEWISAPPQSAVLLLAGPRAGKTTCVVIPALLAHPGAAVATSTKPEVVTATLGVRRQLGRAWFFDLQGTGAPDGSVPLRWSPVSCAGDWQRAQLVAEAMAGSADVDQDAAHWIERAGALIACCLHAAARSGEGMRELVGWVLRHDPDAPLAELEPSSLAHDVLSGIKHTADRECASIFSTAARVLRAYRSEIALAASDDPNSTPTRSWPAPTPSTSLRSRTSSDCSHPWWWGC
jgi:hypothetical protein